MSLPSEINPLLIGSNAYQISRSVRFRSASSTSFSYTPVSAGNRKTWTWSGWVKRGTLGVTGSIFGNYFGTDDYSQFHISFNTSNQLIVSLYTTTEIGRAHV